MGGLKTLNQPISFLFNLITAAKLSRRWFCHKNVTFASFRSFHLILYKFFMKMLL